MASPSDAVEVREITEMPADLDALVAKSERDGHRHLTRLRDQWRDGTNRFDKPGEALFGAFLGERLVGVCGLNVDPYAGDDRVGRVRRLFVDPAARGRGVGGALVRAVVERARGRFDRLRLRTFCGEQGAMYRRAGFTPVYEPEASHVMELNRPQ